VDFRAIWGIGRLWTGEELTKLKKDRVWVGIRVGVRVRLGLGLGLGLGLVDSALFY